MNLIFLRKRVQELQEIEINYRRMNEELRREQILLETLINNLPDAIFAKDKDYRKTLSNIADVHYIGFVSESEVLGKTDFELFPKEIAEKFIADDKSVIENGQTIINRLEFQITSNGEKRWMCTSKLPLRNDEGNITGLIGIARNITDRKEAEEALKKAYDELEKKNIDLEKANKVKSQFLANMSHEIRTPLNAIIGMSTLMLNTELNDEQKEFAKTIVYSGDILLNLINDILDFSKIEAQKIELEKHPFEIRECIEETLELMASKAEEKKLELTYFMDDKLPSKVNGDVTRLRQILVNLINNAIKFTERGEIVTTVTGHLNDNFEYRLHFCIKDSGLGIPPEKQNRLFDSFNQIDSSTTRKFGGTGLGLAISKQLCELMEGQIWVESSGISGEGSAFHFTILTELSKEKIIPNDLSGLTGKRVLIVDDNLANRVILKKQILSMNMLPIDKASGEEALILLKENEEFDLAILDYYMPGMDGIELAKKIRLINSGKKIPLILLSSISFKQKTGLGPDFSAVLTKPIKFSKLQNILSTVLNAKNTRL